MTDKTSNDSRRKLLKSIVAGSGAVVAGKTLPESWSKPVIDSVMLPAHAGTTTEEETGSYWSLNVQATGFGTFNPNQNGIHACIMVTGDMADVTFQGGANKGRRNAVAPTDGTIVDAGVVASATNCNVKTNKISISAVSSESVTFKVYSPDLGGDFEPFSGGYEVTIKAGTCGAFPAVDNECDES